MDIRQRLFQERKPEILEREIAGFGKLWFRVLPESERIQKYDFWLTGKDGKPNEQRRKDLRLWLVVCAMCDESGSPVLTAEDLPQMRDWPTDAVSAMAEVSMRCLGLSDDDLGDKVKKKSNESDTTSD